MKMTDKILFELAHRDPWIPVETAGKHDVCFACGKWRNSYSAHTPDCWYVAAYLFISSKYGRGARRA